MSSSLSGSVQQAFLEHLRQCEESVTVFLVNGVKLQGVIVLFDDRTLVLRRDGHVQLVYKHAVSTIMPVASMPDFTQELIDGSEESVESL
ncbi:MULTISPECIES: RNA chaperone Hfq [unclassified Saccharibacter]|uniref:RNA chaperone Hfq n=1 Tax=unclassified Saccharibacter TaxID=2648722 RepID=UPI00132B5C84|nr:MULTISPECIES: RNA chaperone Hfq [unclassified Saccharibacter]MXV36663.1 RNA chaperone Hfq [Saccharibacter sp. EH611]MXV58777.1 RNA chaperone Hfq [Saccharibacter sp. EH70]MXV65611.1 RNA chaperone Hfq [Saccharibacter sp. EH60]